ncbi:zinc-binding alcohol dehydrogenase [Marinobacter adhaerens]|uniref:Zinc-binding alcohol dehydrogenase n=2 Tax=Marinobacter adhaerens TaxID=1033846 RepID=A0ABX8IHI9_9GAMM|nr:zinc-binding alcohol dehydrogenase [Marinobacter adhaerens]MAM52029.1 dehydrogenase [Marinobacter sp.]ADP97705.1 alcohol dehydrogenase zinc-binding domain protein [Marinobacter adhaerens HP15]MBW4978352.1 zinc-binding alcohol dehydrogenase [Marinobacter adhaerens]MCW8977590.1 zinc-binding alcohol dehydrogenase [Marinobacter sp.]QWV11764.1 zinc-binding alcohol dehydrogenase [Marinobacter adhaerens]
MHRDPDEPNTESMARAWWVTGAGKGEILETPLVTSDDEQKDESVTVQALYSGISRGTESLVFHGRVPKSEYAAMRAPFQEGDFPWPVKYGYASVGKVVEGPAELVGQTVFCLYPHQNCYRVPASALTPLPKDLPAERAILAANMETAVNGLWDGAPAVGDRIAVVGLGVVGLLVAWLASRIPGARVTAIDTNPERQAVAEQLGLTFSSESAPDDHDLVIHASGHPSGLETALGLAGQEATIVEMSWYGDQLVSAPLGAAFHPRRLTLKSSQVGQIVPSRVPRWDYRKRLALALELLQDDALDVLITGECKFDDLPKSMARILIDGRDTLCHRVVY